MSDSLSRRDFLKLTGVGALTTAVLTGCGPAARYVVRKPYYSMPEYNQTGVSTYYATTCRDCAAGCGLIMRTFEGRAIKAEGNPNHPVSRGKICSRGLTTVQELYNPDRLKSPQRQARGGGSVEQMQWDAAIQVVADALQNPGGVAFLLGSSPSHLYHLAQEMAGTLGTLPPVRYDITQLLNGVDTLTSAANAVYGGGRPPFFDLENADFVFSFGANFLESWLSPVSYARAYGRFRQGDPQRRGYLVSFEPRMSQTTGVADEWIPVAPGSEGLVAAALGGMIAEARGMGSQAAFAGADLNAAVQAAGVDENRLRRLAERFANAQRPLAIPGSGVATHANGLEATQAVLLLNVLVDNLDGPGGVFFPPQAPTPNGQAGQNNGQADPNNGQADQNNGQGAASAMAGIAGLIERMNAGDVQTLFVHGVNPVFDLPGGLGFGSALANVPQVISFASFEDETAQQADYIFPDHTALESFGYQELLPGSDRPVVSAIQPVVAPLYDTRSTVDVLLAAGGMPYADEVDFIQARLGALTGAAGGTIGATQVLDFWTQFLQHGGWWAQEASAQSTFAGANGTPAAGSEEDEAEEGAEDQEQAETPAAGPTAGLDQRLTISPAPAVSEGRFHLVVYTGLYGDGRVTNRPWIQETPHSMTTAMWNSWVEIHPDTAHELGVTNDDIVRITSDAGEVEAIVYLYPAIRPDTVAVPFGQGHTAYGRYAQGRGFNPAVLLGSGSNAADDLAAGDVMVTITPTGQRRPLSRLESREGVYGEHR